jgi:hypothetical protein
MSERNIFEARAEYFYKAGFGPYMDKDHENWTFVDVPEHLALKDTAQAARRNAKAESAQMFTYLPSGERVYWYFSSRDKDGGGMSYAVETPKDAAAAWERITKLDYVVELEVTLRDSRNTLQRKVYRKEVT